MERFRGQAMHSGRFPGGAAYAGKRVVVIGAGNSAIDICQDLVYHEADSVTMIQRSSTCVASRVYQLRAIGGAFPDDVPTEVSDFRAMAMPFALLKRLNIAVEPEAREFHEDMYEKLRNAGLKVHLGPEGQGLYILYLERGGGAFLSTMPHSLADTRSNEQDIVRPRLVALGVCRVLTHHRDRQGRSSGYDRRWACSSAQRDLATSIHGAGRRIR